MNSEYVKHRLNNITYTDSTDAVSLRYLLLTALADIAGEYRLYAGSAYALQLLKQHKQLDNIHSALKEKLRNNQLTGDDFAVARNKALKCLENYLPMAVYTTAA